MTNKQRLAVALKEKKDKLSDLAGLESLSDQQRAELDTATREVRDLDSQMVAALLAEPDPVDVRTAHDGESRELRELLGKCDMGALFQSVLEHRAIDGPVSELQKKYGLDSNQIPLDMLRETRAVTPGPANTGQDQAEIVPGVFPQSCAAWLGIDMPSVNVGEQVYPVLTTNAVVRTPAENADADDTTGSFTADVLSPSRLQAAFFFSREDMARFRGMSESLRMNLSDALSDGLDKAILSGVSGLLTGTNLPNHAAAAVTTYAGYLSSFGYSRVDGKYAAMTADLRVVAGSGTYAHMGSVYRANESDMNALDRLMAISGGVKVSSHVPAVSNAHKQNAVIRLGMRRDAVAPIWSVTLIPDEVTKAKQGQVVITAVMMAAQKILRADGFYKQESQHA